MVCRRPGAVRMEQLAASDRVWISGNCLADWEESLQCWVLYTFFPKIQSCLFLSSKNLIQLTTCQWLDNCWTMFCQTVQYLDSVVSNSPMVGYAVYNCPMACELSVQQSNGRTVLFPTVQWSYSPVSNFPKVG